MLACEEGMLPLPDSTNLTPLFQNPLTESEIIATTLLGNYEANMARLLFQLIREQFDESKISLPFSQLLDLEESDEDVKRADILDILEDINDFVHESEVAIDTFSSTSYSSKTLRTKVKAVIIWLVFLDSTVKSLISEIGCNNIHPATMVLISVNKATKSFTY